MKVKDFAVALNYVRQFANYNAGVLHEPLKRVRIDAREQLKFECGSFEQGGNITLPLEPLFQGIGEIEVDVYELSDFANALSQEAEFKVSLDGGLFVMKSGRASRKFETYPIQTHRQVTIEGEWHKLPDTFKADIKALEKLKIKGTLVSSEDLLYYKENSGVSNLFLVRQKLPRFQLAQDFVPKLLSCDPTHIYVDDNRVAFKNDSRLMTAPLIVSKTPMVNKMLEKTIKPNCPTIKFNATELKEACKVLFSDSVDSNIFPIQISKEGLSCGQGDRTKYAIEVKMSEEAPGIRVSRQALQHISDIGFETDGKITLNLSDNKNIVFSQKDRYIYTSCTIFNG